MNKKDKIKRRRLQTNIDENIIRALNIISATNGLGGANHAIEKVVKEYCEREGINYEMENK